MINTIKKIYRHTKAGLCIGLLSLNTLSSCVNTRQTLSATTSIEQKQSRPLGTRTKSCNRILRIKPLCYALAFVGMVTTFLPLALGGFFWVFNTLLHSSNTSNLNMHKGNSVTTDTSLTPASLYTNTTLLYNMTSNKQPIS